MTQTTVELLLLLRPSASQHVYAFSERLDDTYFRRLRKNVTIGFSPFPSCPDILYQPKDRAFVGLTYQVSAPYWKIAKDLAKRLDPKFIRLFDLSTAAERRRYPNERGRVQRMEVRWSAVQGAALLTAQLAEPYWCYTQRTEGHLSVLGLGVPFVDQILEEFDLKLPTTLRIPHVSMS